jgi:glycosyltransferase involved in cell wall biosynthesis
MCSDERYYLVAGLEQSLDKIGRHYRHLSDALHAKAVIYSRDPTGASRKVCQGYGLDFHAVPEGRKILDILGFARLVRSYRPSHAELYLYGAQHAMVYFGYFLVLLVSRVPLVCICRGGELLFYHKFSLINRLAFRVGLHLASLVVYKQLHMPEQLRRLNIPMEKCAFFHNRIPWNPASHEVSSRGVLFLNSWRGFRRPDIAFQVALNLAPSYPDVMFTIAGARPSDRGNPDCPLDFQEAQDKIQSLGITNIRLLPWTDHPAHLFDEHHIFLLPATLVFLNYTLLEAMERGLVPVVSKADGVDLVIDDGVDGCIVDLDAAAFTLAVERLLADSDRCRQMGMAARQKIRRSFDLDDGFKQLSEVYRTKARV